MKKTIIFLLYRECTYLPPFMTILEAMSDNYSLKVISYEHKGWKQKLEDLYKGKDVSFLSNETQPEATTFKARVGRRLRKDLHIPTAFHTEAERLLAETPHDLLWVIHEETAFEFRN